VVAKILGQKILVIFLPKSLEVCKEYYTFATRSRKRKWKEREARENKYKINSKKFWKRKKSITFASAFRRKGLKRKKIGRNTYKDKEEKVI
jgi:hypothetical protein